MIPLLPGFLQVGEERIPGQLVLRHPSGESWKVPSEPVRFDQSVVVVEAHHSVLGVPRSIDYLGGVEKSVR